MGHSPRQLGSQAARLHPHGCTHVHSETLLWQATETNRRYLLPMGAVALLMLVRGGRLLSVHILHHTYS